MAAKFKTGERVQFAVGRRVYTGVMVNPVYYPGGTRAGKHYRVRVASGMVATVFANGPAGRSMEHVEEET